MSDHPSAPAKTISPGLKAALEYGPLLAFFVGYLLMKGKSFTVMGTDYDGFVAVTALFIPVLAIATLLQWRLTGHISKMQIATLVLVVVFGGLSVWFNDERFFKMKPTMIYVLFAAILGFGLMRGESYLAAVMDQALPLEREGWMILTRRLLVFFLFLAVANEVIWRNFSTTTWVNFKVFGLTISTFVFFIANAGVFSKYGIDEEGKGE